MILTLSAIRGTIIHIHGVGPMINIAIKLALQLKRKNDELTWNIKTDTVTLIDDVIPVDDVSFCQGYILFVCSGLI
jgi:hypothetical protein